MEKKLKALFDFQKFEGNNDLNQVINSVHARYGMQQNSSVRELSMDEMDWVSAAGTSYVKKDKKNEPT